MSAEPELRTTACPLDCPDSCTLEVGVSGGRLVSVGAAPEGTGNPLTAGWICAKVRRHAERVHGPGRLTTPLVRTGPKGAGAFREAGWDEALDLVAARIGEAVAAGGPATVVPFLYNSSAGAAADRLTSRLFGRLGTSVVAHTICAATAGRAWDDTFGTMASADPLDVAHSELVVVWGANPSVSNTHFGALLTAARRRGATVVVVDPRRTPTAARADLHIAPLPGTDVVLALGVAAEIERRGLVDAAFCEAHATGVEEVLAAARQWSPERAAATCGVDAAVVGELAELIARRRPGLLRVGWGLERNRNGAAAVRSALALWVLAGQFGGPGSGVVSSTSDAAGPVLARLGLGEEAVGEPARVLNMNHLGRDLLGAEPPIDVLFVQGANPAVMAPDQVRVLEGLAREDLFCVVHDQVLTDTAALADVVLPATTHFEVDGVAAGYGSFLVSPMPAVIDRVGQSRTNDEVAAALAGRLGLGRWDPTPPSLPTQAIPSRASGTIQFGPPGDPATTVPEGGRAHLGTGGGAAGPPRFETLDDPHPLVLLTPASPRLVNSIFGETDPPAAVIAMSPQDAAARSVSDGTEVRVFNDRAELRLPAVIDEGVRPGVVVIPKGLWRASLTGGLTANALIPDDVESSVGGACFNDARVEVAPL